MTIQRQTRYPLRFGRIIAAIVIATLSSLTAVALAAELWGTLEPGEASCIDRGGSYDPVSSVCTFLEPQEIYGFTIITDTIAQFADDAYLAYEVYGFGPSLHPFVLTNLGLISATGDFHIHGGRLNNMGTFVCDATLRIDKAFECFQPSWSYPSSTCDSSIGIFSNEGDAAFGGHVRITGIVDNQSTLLTSGVVDVVELCTEDPSWPLGGLSCWGGVMRNDGVFTNTGLLHNCDSDYVPIHGFLENSGQFFNAGTLDSCYGRMRLAGQIVNSGLLQNRRLMQQDDGILVNSGVFANHYRFANYAVISNTGVFTSSEWFANHGVVASTVVMTNSGTLYNVGTIDGPIYNTGLILNTGHIVQKITGPGTVIDMPYQTRFPFMARQ